MKTETSKTEIKEILHPEEIFLLTPVFQLKWYPGDIDPERVDALSDKIRGDLIIENLKKANESGYSVILVHDPKDNPQFLDALKEVVPVGKNKIVVSQQLDTTYSGARRDAIRLALKETNCTVVVMLELEKPMVEHIPAMVQPILNDIADVSITDRGIKTDGELSEEPQKDNEDLRQMPVYQARSEKNFSNWANNFLKKMYTVSQEAPDIDWMGNRAWRNRSDINSLFLARYISNSEREAISDLNPDHISSSLFYPMVEILRSNDIRIISVPIDYNHPKIQSDLENRDTNFKLKRDKQRKMLKHEMVEFVRYLYGKDSSVKLGD